MARYGTLLTAAAAALCAATLARADFQGALKDYKAGRYDVAHSEFLALAELGDCSSQFNLAAMALQGQGGPADTASGVGWLQAAADNGCQQLVDGKLPRLKASLNPEQSEVAAKIVQRYGHETLRAEGVIDPPFNCADVTAASVVSAASPEYPAHDRRSEGIVIAAMTIGVDGRARDPQILLAEPDRAFGDAAVDAWLNSRFTPAMRGGQPIESRLQLKQVFSRSGAQPLAELEVFRGARPRADGGDAAAAYLVGLSASDEPSLGISPQRASALLISSARDGDPQSQYWIGSQLRANAACHPHADGRVWLQHAAEGGSAPARLALAADLLQGSPDSAQQAQARTLLQQAASADDEYVRKHVAALLAASPVAGVRDPARAEELALKLAAGPWQSDPQVFEVLALAYSAKGDFRQAAARQELAIGRAERLGWVTRAMNERLASYRSGRPWSGELFSPP